MTVDVLGNDVGTGSEHAGRCILLSGDDGGWTLSGSDRPARRFSDLDAALDGARRATLGLKKAATIEIWLRGQYICCLQPRGPVHRGASGRRSFTTAERYANRAARIMMSVAGVLFWLTLMFAAVAACLGLKLFLL